MNRKTVKNKPIDDEIFPPEETETTGNTASGNHIKKRTFRVVSNHHKDDTDDLFPDYETKNETISESDHIAESAAPYDVLEVTGSAYHEDEFDNKYELLVLEPEGKGFDMLENAIDMLGAAFEEAARLNEEEQELFFNKARELIGTHGHKEGDTSIEVEARNRIIPPPLPEPDNTGKTYALYPGRTHGNPLGFLEDNWGQWLKKYNHDRDYIYQDQLRERDPALMRALDAQVRRNGWQLKSFVPPKKERTDAEYEQMGKPSDVELRRMKKCADAYLKRAGA